MMHVKNVIYCLGIALVVALQVVDARDTRRPANVYSLISASRDAVASGNLDDAVEFARAAVESDPAFVDAWKQYGRAGMLRGVDEETLNAFEKVWVLNPSWNDEAAVWRVQTMLRLERFERLHLLFEDVEDEDLNEVEVAEVIQWLDFLLSAGREEVAVVLARRKASVVENPAVSTLLHALADFCDYETETIPEGAAAWATTSREAQQIGSMLYHHAGRRAQNWKNTDKSLGLFDQAIKIDSGRHEAMGDKGWGYFQRGQFEDAIRVWEEELEPGVAHPEAWMVWIGLAFTETGDLVSAETWAEKALALDEAFPEAIALKSSIQSKRDGGEKINAVKNRRASRHRDFLEYSENAAIRFDAMLSRQQRAALEQIRTVVDADPSDAAWVDLVRLSERIDKPETIDALLDEALEAPVAPSVLLRLKSFKARRTGKIDNAVLLARQSLGLNPEQSSLRSELFDLYAAQGRFKEAGIQVVRIEERLMGDEKELLPLYGSLLVKMGRHQNGTAIWNSVRSRSPYAVRYALEVANYLETQCRAREAADVLNGLIRSGETSARVYAYLGGIELSLGHYEKAISVVDQGLDISPAPSLYRQRAELAEIAFDWESGKFNAIRCLEYDSGYVQMHRLASRCMLALKEYEETVSWNEPLVERNDAYVQSHVDLRNAYTRLGERKKALDYSKRYNEMRPWDPEGVRRLAITYAENKKMTKGLRAMKPLADLDVNQAVPVVMFRHVTSCDLRGQNNHEQVSEQLRLLANDGYAFVAPDELNLDKDNAPKRIMVVIADPDPASFRALDRVLAEVNGKAVLAVDVPEYREALLHAEPPLSLSKATESGRWFLASSGPADLKRVSIRKDGRLMGNPLTHRIMVDGKRETLAEMKQRLNALFAEAAEALPSAFPVLVYPFGDYGQLSLDCLPGEIRVLREVVEQHFEAAISHGDNGFIIPGYDPLRIPAKSIPAPAFIESTSFEKTTSLPEYLTPRNPILRAKFDIAKLLYWHRQHQRANERFSEAYELGADPGAVLFNWGANAFRQGDLPTALERLRRAREIGSLDQEKILDALYQAEKVKAPRAKLHVSGWEDSDDREYSEWGGMADFYLRDDLRLGVFYDAIAHEREGVGEEDATRVGVDAKWHLVTNRWLTAKVWLMDFDSSEIDDHVGGTVNLHVESSALNGHVELEYSRDQIQTVEAVREEVLGDMFRVRVYSFLADRLDLYANGDYIARTDDNDTWFVGGRALYRLMEWPYLGVGYRGRFGDSDMDTAIYYTPQELERHTAFVSLRGSFSTVNISLAGEWGQAREAGADWVDVWSARAQGNVHIYGTIEAVGSISHLETPTYELDTYSIGLQARF